MVFAVDGGSLYAERRVERLTVVSLVLRLPAV